MGERIELIAPGATGKSYFCRYLSRHSGWSSHSEELLQKQHRGGVGEKYQSIWNPYYRLLANASPYLSDKDKVVQPRIFNLNLRRCALIDEHLPQSETCLIPAGLLQRAFYYSLHAPELLTCSSYAEFLQSIPKPKAVVMMTTPEEIYRQRQGMRGKDQESINRRCDMVYRTDLIGNFSTIIREQLNIPLIEVNNSDDNALNDAANEIRDVILGAMNDSGYLSVLYEPVPARNVLLEKCTHYIRAKLQFGNF